MTAAKLVLIPAIAIMASGCAYSASGESYPRYGTRVAQDVKYGEVVSARAVKIEGDASVIGVWGGAGVGRAAGGSSVARAIGTVAGAVAGAAIEREITAEDGVEITVRLDAEREYERTIAVVQAADVEFLPGERVKVLFGPYHEARVTRL